MTLFTSQTETIILISACAIVSALAAKLVLITFKRNHLGFILLWMIAFPVTLTVTFLFLMPEIRNYRSRAIADRFIADDPLLSIASDLDSGVARSLHGVMATLVDQGYTGQPARLMAFRQSLGVIMPVFDAYAPVASDESLRRYVLRMLAVLRELRGRPGAPCYWFATGSTRPDGRTFDDVSEVRIEDLSLAMAEVLQSGRDHPVAAMSGEDRDAFVDELFNRVEARFGPAFGNDLLLLDRADLSDDERERICRVLVALYSELIEMPSPLREGATRALLIR